MRQMTIAVLLMILAGCGASSGSGSGGILDRLGTLPDANGNGFPDIPAPPGVEETQTVPLQLINEITMSQAERLAKVNLPDFVKNIVSIRARLLVNLTYPGDITDRLTGTRAVAPFEVKAEVVCPMTMEVRVTVVADIPVIGQRTVQSFGPFQFQRDALVNGFECGSMIAIEVFVNEDGDASSTTKVQPMPEG